VLKIARNPVTRTDQFMFCGVTLAKVGQKLKNSTKARYAQAKALFAIPRTPLILHGPQTIGVYPSSEGIEEIVRDASALVLDTMPPVQRRHSKRTATNRYDPKRPAMETETTPLNAVVEPMLISTRIAVKPAVAATPLTGIAVLVLIYYSVSRKRTIYACETYLTQNAPSGKALVARERPENSGTRCEASGHRGDSHDHDQRRHCGCP
jgi:hypothetical protein